MGHGLFRFHLSFPLSASSICLSYGFLFFFVFSPYLRHFLSTPIIDLRLALFFPRFFLLVGAITLFVLLRAAFFFSLFFLPFRTYVPSSHIRIVILPVVAVGAHATAVPQPAGPCYERVISGRKICNGVRDCRGSNEIQYKSKQTANYYGLISVFVFRLS